MATSNLASQELHINHKLPTWNGDWLTWSDYRLQVELETDGTATDDLAKLGPRLVRNLTHKAWECCSEIDREKLKKADGVEYLLSYLESKRGKQKVDLLGDALSAYFQQPDVARKDGENWSDFETRHSAKIRDITKALKETGTGTAVPQEIYGWFLVHQFLRLEPSDVATVKSVAASYKLTDISAAMTKLWGGLALSQKDAERKKMKATGRIMMNEPDDDQHAWFEDTTLPDSDSGEQLEDIMTMYEEAAEALAESPGDPEILANFQEIKKIKYKEARKALDRSRVSRGFYPSQRSEGRNSQSGNEPFHGTCLRCGKKGHKAKFCRQQLPSKTSGQQTGRVGFVGMVLTSENVNDTVEEPAPEPLEIPLPIFAVENVIREARQDDCFIGAAISQHSHKAAVIDCGASESIVGVTVLQDFGDELKRLGFDPETEISVNRELQRNFIFGNGQSSGALGLADVTTGILGKEVTIPFHVVDGPTPFLLSNQWLANSGAVINFSTGRAVFSKFSDRQFQLERTSTGHLTIPLTIFGGNSEQFETHFVKESDRDVPVDELAGVQPNRLDSSE